MKTNKLGIPISNNKDNIEGHSIIKNDYIYNKNRIFYFRLFRSINPYTNNLYGIHLYKIYHNVHNI